MAKAISNVNIATDTFGVLVDRVNQIANTISNETLTAIANTTGATTSGNVVLNGIFVPNVLVANVSMRGGNISTSADLLITSNVVSNAIAVFRANTSHNGAATFANTVAVTGTVTMSANLSVDTNVLKVDAVNNRVGLNVTSPTETLDVNGKAKISGNVDIRSSSNIASTLTIDSVFPQVVWQQTSGDVNGKYWNILVVSNTISLSAISDDFVTSNTFLQATRSGTDIANVVIRSPLTSMNGNAVISGSATLSNTITVTGNATFSNTLAVTGNATFSNIVNITGNVVLSDRLNVTNVATFSNAVTFPSGSTVQQSSRWSSNTTIFNIVSPLTTSSTIVATGNVTAPIHLTSGATGAFICVSRNTGNNFSMYCGSNSWRVNGAGSDLMTLTSDGNLSVVGTVTPSDRRLKTNINVLNDALSKVNTWTGYNYTRTDVGDPLTIHAGVIAQEVQQTAPELVLTNPETGMMAVNYQAMVAYLIESVKELTQRISTLEASINKG